MLNLSIYVACIIVHVRAIKVQRKKSRRKMERWNTRARTHIYTHAHTLSLFSLLSLFSFSLSLHCRIVYFHNYRTVRSKEIVSYRRMQSCFFKQWLFTAGRICNKPVTTESLTWETGNCAEISTRVLYSHVDRFPRRNLFTIFPDTAYISIKVAKLVAKRVSLSFTIRN